LPLRKFLRVGEVGEHLLHGPVHDDGELEVDHRFTSRVGLPSEGSVSEPTVRPATLVSEQSSNISSPDRGDSGAVIKTIS